MENSIYSLTFVSMMREIKAEFKLDAHLEDYFFKATMVFFIQILIIFLILASVPGDEDGNEFTQPTTTNIVLRLLCCYLFHLSNYGDVSDSYKRLKFLV